MSSRRLVVLTVLSVVAYMASVTATAFAGAAGHKTGQSRGEVVSYWTDERMRGAIPADRGRGNAPNEMAKPGGGTSGGGATSVEPATYPSAHGKVFFSDGTYNYVCSGTALTSQNESVVWTAGHCVNEGPGGFYTNFMFVPAYRDGAEPYGRFAATDLKTTTRWQTAGEYGVDLGAAIVGRNAAGQTLSAAVDERTPVFNSLRQQSYTLYGYPAERKFNGQRMRVCNTAWSRNDASADPDTMGVPCDMNGGSSGGGWVTSTGQVASVVSYGYGSLKNVLFGPYQATEAQQLYTAAEAP